MWKTLLSGRSNEWSKKEKMKKQLWPRNNYYGKVSTCWPVMDKYYYLRKSSFLPEMDYLRKNIYMCFLLYWKLIHTSYFIFRQMKCPIKTHTSLPFPFSSSSHGRGKCSVDKCRFYSLGCWHSDSCSTCLPRKMGFLLFFSSRKIFIENWILCLSFYFVQSCNKLLILVIFNSLVLVLLV